MQRHIVRVQVTFETERSFTFSDVVSALSCQLPGAENVGFQLIGGITDPPNEKTLVQIQSDDRQPIPGGFYMVSGTELRALKALSSRLFTEDRMQGGEMRDAAQVLDAIVRVSSQMPVGNEGA